MATFTRARLEATVRACRAALRRIEDGSYGKCAECGERLPDARLKALPAALRCRPCEEQREAMAEPDGASESVYLDRTRRLSDEEAGC